MNKLLFISINSSWLSLKFTCFFLIGFCYLKIISNALLIWVFKCLHIILLILGWLKFFFFFFCWVIRTFLDLIFISSFFLTVNSSSKSMNYSVEVLHILPCEAFAIIWLQNCLWWGSSIGSSVVLLAVKQFLG